MDALKQPGFVLNIDIDTAKTPFLNYVVAKTNPVESDLYPFVDIYADTQITDICFDIFCQYSATPTAVWTDAIAKCRQTEENGFPVCYEKQYASITKLYTVYNLDPYHIWFKRCREKGIRSWLSIRMNDCHCPDDDTCFLRSDFFYEAREKGWMIGDDFGYYRYCFNYAVPEVRKKMLDYIEEQLRQYPEADGLELDFSREFYCFGRKDLPQAPAIMNDFIKQVRALTKQAEHACGHSIPIMIRVNRDISTAMDFGYDVATWVKEGLCDVIVPCPRWASNDSDMPIDQWKKMFPDFPIYAGLEILTNRAAPAAFANEEVIRGYAHEYWSLGADKIYQFNYFTLPKGMDAPHLNYDKVIGVFRTCGLPETAKQGPRRFIVTYQDVAMKEETRYKPLPMAVPVGESASIAIATGKAETSSKLLVGLDAGAPVPQVVCNGQPCAYLGADSRENPYAHPGTCLFAYELPVFTEVRQTLSFTSPDGDTSITYLEVETENA